MSTPVAASSTQRSRSASASHNRPLSRPTTPLRPSSRSSLRASQNGSSDHVFPLETLEPQFAELADSMADLEANYMHLQIMHESLARFSENFGGFLYGLNMNAFCVDFPEAPVKESWGRVRDEGESGDFRRSTNSEKFHDDAETTFLTTDTSFVDNPPTSSKSTPKKFTTPAPASKLPSRGGIAPTAGRGGVARGGLRGTRSSGLARATTRGRGVK
ncbi:DASH complex subunit Dam1-domain-containing protein [Calycina marina]|uniref:DASH complex subunit DAM1 n=1 Tax=Calycina marina TaxID=1763456 RepID=A0A9P8CEK4_9HELO|nr:DASH complex subunit Dam1-domain-containing protein [Calycina marina]